MEMPEIDLLDNYDVLPTEVKLILDKHQENWDDTYENCAKLKAELETVGYTVDYYLDATPFNLKKL